MRPTAQLEARSFSTTRLPESWGAWVVAAFGSAGSCSGVGMFDPLEVVVSLDGRVQNELRNRIHRPWHAKVTFGAAVVRASVPGPVGGGVTLLKRREPAFHAHRLHPILFEAKGIDRRLGIGLAAASECIHRQVEGDVLKRISVLMVVSSRSRRTRV